MSAFEFIPFDLFKSLLILNLVYGKWNIEEDLENDPFDLGLICVKTFPFILGLQPWTWFNVSSISKMITVEILDLDNFFNPS